jgi:hypothetical protein
MSNVVIDIAAEFTGKKAFKQADSAAKKLTKTIGDVAKGFGVAFGARALAQYSKQAILAFAADDKAARVLSRTLNNLGLAFADPAVKTFISDLEKQYGVLDDFLRPAYQKLVTTTGDWRKSQELLKTALDLSAQSGVDVVSVADDIARAFAGNTKGLQKYGLGLSKAQLSAMSFEEVLARITKISNGQAALAAETYTGKLDKLNVAAANASETIGGALIDAFATFAGNGSIDKATAKIDFFSKLLATIISPKLMAEALGQVDFKFGIIPTMKTPLTNRSKSPAGTYARNQAEIKAAAAAKKQQADLLASNKKTLKSQQDALKLAKAKAIFDLQKIQIEAALKGKISEEDRIRLKLMQAIQDENISQIDTYTKALSEVQAKVITLQSTLAEVYSMDVGNPFISWEIGLDGVKRALIEVNGQSIELTNTIAQNSLAAGLAGGASFAQALSGARYAAQAAAAAGISGATGVMPQVPTAGSGGTAGGGSTTVVQVTVEGSVIAENDLNQAINNALAASGWAGSAIGYSRQAVITAI